MPVKSAAVCQAAHKFGGVSGYDAVGKCREAHTTTAKNATAILLSLVASDDTAYALKLAIGAHQQAARIARRVVCDEDIGQHGRSVLEQETSATVSTGQLAVNARMHAPPHGYRPQRMLRCQLW